MEDKNPYEMEAANDIPKIQFENIFQDEKKAVDVPKKTNNIPSLSGDLRTESDWNQVNTLKENKIDNINNNISDSLSNNEKINVNKQYDYLDVPKLMREHDNNEIHDLIEKGELTESAIKHFNLAAKTTDGSMQGFKPYVKSNDESYRNTWINDFIGDSEATYDSKTGTIKFKDEETRPNLSGNLRTEDEWNDILDFKEKKLTSGVYYNEEATINLDKKLISLRDEIKDIQVKNINVACICFDNLNIDTKNKLKEISITSDTLNNDLLSYSNNWYNELDNVIDNLEKIQKRNDEINANNGGSKKGNYESINGSSSSSSTPSKPSSSPNSPVLDIEAENNNSGISLLNAIVGVITFTEIIPLYEEIGSSSNVSANLTGNYGLIGIEKRDSDYYYKLLDTKTNKIYYVKFSDKVKIETKIKDLIEIKDNTMMLNSTEIGTNNFVKLTDANMLYFVQDTVENQGITFYSVLDGSDGNSYYIPQGDEVLLTTLDEISEKISGDN